MPTLNIEGKRVRVDDAFLKLSPEDQNAQVEEIAAQIRGTGGQNTAPSTGMGAAAANAATETVSGARRQRCCPVRDTGGGRWGQLEEGRSPIVG